MSDFYKLSAKAIDGSMRSMKACKGRVLLIVNVASGCGFTPQYAGLEALWRKYGKRGLTVLGFPCNQFGVNGADTHPIFAFLKAGAPGLLGSESVKWNFTKFLVDRKGRVVGRYASSLKPEDMAADIEKLL